MRRFAIRDTAKTAIRRAGRHQPDGRHPCTSKEVHIRTLRSTERNRFRPARARAEAQYAPAAEPPPITDKPEQECQLGYVREAFQIGCRGPGPAQGQANKTSASCKSVIRWIVAKRWNQYRAPVQGAFRRPNAVVGLGVLDHHAKEHGWTRHCSTICVVSTSF